MASRNFTPVNFALEKNVVQIFARVVFGASGVPILDTNNSKGVCNVGIQTVSFTGATTNSSSTVGTVSSFNRIFTGMTVTGSTGSLQAATTIGTVTATTDSLVLSSQAILTGAVNTLTASGGQYIFQFGTQAGFRLDTYNKLLDFNYSWDESTGSASGTATTAQLAPGISSAFVVQNNSAIRTIPATGTSNSTDATIVVQMGTGTGTGFVAANPASGEVLRVQFTFGNSTAI